LTISAFFADSAEMSHDDLTERSLMPIRHEVGVNDITLL